MYRLNQVKLNIHHSESDFKKKIAKSIGVSVGDINWSLLTILHKAIDARDKNNILFVYNVAFDFVSDIMQRRGDALRALAGKLEKYEPINFNPIVSVNEGVGANFRSPRMGELCEPNVRESNRPVVVGFGPAGIFAAYILALNGLKPIVVERGKSLEERTKDTEKFFETMELDENSNVCFGEGGAGAFSDGKLNTNNKDKTGIYKFVLETFVKFGADEKILYENLPHIGTDKLVDVIKNIRNEILRLGGEIHYNTKLTFENPLAVLAPTTRAPQAFAPTEVAIAPIITKDTPIILAIGNSSRDTFRELIENGFDVKAKAIAVGYRIAHEQSFINSAQYGDEKLLGPATYKLTYDVGDGHSVYSFCMCPGGYIINSSNYKGMLSINGMSYNDRSGKYANSAIVVTVRPEDVEGLAELANTTRAPQVRNSPVDCFAPTKEGQSDAGSQCSPLRMIEFQERVEKAAFELANGFIPYVTSDENDICSEDMFKGQARYCEKLKSVYENCGLKFDINKDIELGLRHFNKIIPGFFGAGSQCAHTIAGVETRTSSPVKLDRDENYMCNVPNFYPCGEGLGHGGGIMSCAVDGIKVALSIAKQGLKSTTIYSG